MKNSIKILILLLSVLVCVGAILIFQKTIVSPPSELEFPDQYNADLKLKLDSIQEVSPNKIENGYQEISDLIGRYHRENAISDDAYDSNYEEFIGIYSPKFSKWSFSLFDAPVWKDSDHEFIEKRIQEIRELKNSDQTLYIMAAFPEENQNFDKILEVISNYRKAQNLINNISFVSIEDARKKIFIANDYANDRYLGNNRELVSKLNTIDHRLADSHYAWLQRKVASLSHYTNYSSLSAYEQAYNTVASDIEAYKNTKLYPGNFKKSTSQMERDIYSYLMKATDYFEALEFNRGGNTSLKLKNESKELPQPSSNR